MFCIIYGILDNDEYYEEQNIHEDNGEDGIGQNVKRMGIGGRREEVFDTMLHTK